MNGFCGRLTALGALEFAPECSPPDECLGCQVLVSGYIADRDDLRHVFSSDAAFQPSNAELLAHAFRKWGPQLPAHVIGEYAAVVWDVRANTALLTHDSLSLAQLFYAPRSEGLAFATHVADLVDDAAAGQLDDEYLADFLARGFITGERTPYRSIRRILPGQSLWWSEGRLRPVRSWNLADVPSRRYGNDAEYEEQFRALLGAGVRASLAGPGPTFISLSGGLDSSSIACAAAGASDLAAYSVICPDWPDTDEQPWMQAVVEHCHMAWHKVDVDEILPFSTLPAGFHGEPSQIAMNEKQLRFQDDLLRSMDSTVMLTGNGGNTLLGANPGEIPVHLVDALFDGKPIAAFRALRGWRDKSNERRSYSYWLSRALMVPALEHLRGRKVSGADRRLSFPPWLKRDYAQKMHLEERARSRIAPACRNPGRQQLWDSLWTLALAMTSIQQRRMSFDIRAPLMYRPLVEFMSGIPWEQKLRPRCDRYLQRRALKGVLPELVRRRATKGSGNPALVEGLRRSSDWFDYLCDKPLMAERGIVEAAQWRDAVRQASVGQTNDDRFFLGGVAVESWLKQLKARASSARRNGLTGTRWPGVVPVLG